jgi:segregation and condensation protein B
MGPPKLTMVETDGSDQCGPDQDGPQGAASVVANPGAAVGAAHVSQQPSPLARHLDSVTRGVEANGLPANIAQLPSADRRENLRVLEALLFAAAEPIDEATLAKHLKSAEHVLPLLEELKGFYASRGINLVKVAGKWAFRTAEDLAYLLERHAVDERKLSKAANETLAIIAYHQPVTRAEIEEIRGVATSAGTLDVLMEIGWVRPRGRRRAPGRPITYGTTSQFLEHFGLDSVKDLPGLAELKGAGLLDTNLPPDFKVPEPTDVAALMPDELPLDAGEEENLELPLEVEPEDPESETVETPTS